MLTPYYKVCLLVFTIIIDLVAYLAFLLSIKTCCVYRIMKISLTIAIGLVWFINGLICKVLGLTPRHEEIVAQILGQDYASIFTVMIGSSEVVMAIWVWSRKWLKFITYTQIGLVLTMNILETIIAPNLLLWGNLNIIWASMFCLVVWFHYRIISKNTVTAS